MEPRPGAQVGPYRVEALIARGGMGAVFRATRADGACVALKVLTGGGRDQQARFEREAQLAARLSHPGVVRVHGAGESGGSRWIAMDLVEGEPLDARCGRVAPLEAAGLVAQVARALEHAHAIGVVHRDVKPSNVLVRADGTALLTDFGVARALEGSSLTRTGALLGTPLFMAPEQSTGQLATAATDVHGLGVLLHTLITGTSPFQRDDAAAVLVAVASARPASPGALRPGVPPALDRLCLRALEKEPARRPTAGELAADLEDLVAGRAQRLDRRSSARVVTAATALVALGAATFALARGRGAAPVAGVASVASTPVAATEPAALARVEPEPAWVRPFLADDGLGALRDAEVGLREDAASRLAPAVRERLARSLATRLAAWRSPETELLALGPAQQAAVRDAGERLVLLHLLAARLDPRHVVSEEHRRVITVYSLTVRGEPGHVAALAELFPDDLATLTYYAGSGGRSRKDPRLLARGLQLAEQAGDDPAWGTLAVALAHAWVAEAMESKRVAEASQALEALLPRALARSTTQPRVASDVLEDAARVAAAERRFDVALERLTRAAALVDRADLVQARIFTALEAHDATRGEAYLRTAIEDTDLLVERCRRGDSEAEGALVFVTFGLLRELQVAGRRGDARAVVDRVIAATPPGRVGLALTWVQHELAWGDEALDRPRVGAALQELLRRVDVRTAELERRGLLDAKSRRPLDQLRADALDASARLVDGSLNADALNRTLEDHPARKLLTAHPR